MNNKKRTGRGDDITDDITMRCEINPPFRLISGLEDDVVGFSMRCYSGRELYRGIYRENIIF